jgi:hypothetical protein
MLIRTRQDQPMNAVGEFVFMKIDEQPERNIQEFHVTEHLGLMDR